jgi:hypothetical protein
VVQFDKMPIAAIFFQTDVDPIPPAALTHIPFTSQPVSSWTLKSDLALFMKDLHDVPMRGIGLCHNLESMIDLSFVRASWPAP